MFVCSRSPPFSILNQNSPHLGIPRMQTGPRACGARFRSPARRRCGRPSRTHAGLRAPAPPARRADRPEGRAWRAWPPMLEASSTSPRWVRTDAPFSIARPASGRSAVITSVPGPASATIRSSAASKASPAGNHGNQRMLGMAQVACRVKAHRHPVAVGGGVDLVLHRAGVGIDENGHVRITRNAPRGTAPRSRRRRDRGG